MVDTAVRHADPVPAHPAPLTLTSVDGEPVAQGDPPAPPQGTKTTKDEELVPSEVWSFPLELELRAPEERGTKQ